MKIKPPLFEVTDSFSKMMIGTIPKKLVEWALLLNQDLTEEFNTGELTMLVTPEGGLIVVQDVRIIWVGTVSKITELYVNDEDLLDVKKNLNYFVAVESLCYDPMAELQATIEAETAPKILATPPARPEDRFDSYGSRQGDVPVIPTYPAYTPTDWADSSRSSSYSNDCSSSSYSDSSSSSSSSDCGGGGGGD